MTSKEVKIQKKIALKSLKATYKRDKRQLALSFKQKKADAKYEKAQAKLMPGPAAVRQKQSAKASLIAVKKEYKAAKYRLKCDFLDRKGETVIQFQPESHPKAETQPSSLSLSISVTYITVFAVLLTLQMVFVLFAYRGSYETKAKDQLSVVRDSLSNAHYSQAAAETMQNDIICCISLWNESETKYTVGKVELIGQLELQNGGGAQQKKRLGAERYIVSHTAVTVGDTPYTLSVVYNMQQEEILYALLVNLLLLSAAIGLGVAGVVGYNVSKKGLRPIYSMTRIMKEINAADLSARLDTNKIRTELREVAETFNNMMDKLEQSYEQQTRFVSDASHELRTPLAVISGYADILSRWGQNEPQVQEEAIRSIREQCQHMKVLLERLLVLSRTDRGPITLHTQEIDLHQMCGELVSDFSLVGGNRRVISAVEKEQKLISDADQLRQILVILLDNAVKFTDEAKGEIKILCEETEQKICLSVQDNGIGISETDQARIFERFYKADASRSKQGGYGLGLSIAKSLCDALGATIRVKSDGNGTTFTVEFTK